MIAGRRIAHLDMDAFYASVELLRYPQLRGLPVVVGGSRVRPEDAPLSTFRRLAEYSGRGVATTATYAARALGVHSGMALMKAARLAPDALLLPADFAQYAHYSRRFKAAVRAIAPMIEDRGIDEIYIDLTDVPGDTVELAGRLKAAVRDATGLSCSIGVTPNKLLAKIASDLDKPDGLTVLGEADVPGRIWPLPVGKINGIGPRAAERLAGLGIRSIGELAAAPLADLIARFGAHSGRWLHDAAHGRDARPVVVRQETKSVSRETTFERDLHPRRDRPELTATLVGLCERVADDLARKGLVGRTIGIKLRFADFRTVTRDTTFSVATRDPALILAASRQCLKRVDFPRPLRLLGVRVAGLDAAADPQRWRQRPLDPADPDASIAPVAGAARQDA